MVVWLGPPSENSGSEYGIHPIPRPGVGWEPWLVPRFVLYHEHRPRECRIAIAAWKAYPSPLRHGRPLGSCATGGQRLWLTVDATDGAAALAQLPPYVRERTVAEEVREVPIP